MSFIKGPIKITMFIISAVFFVQTSYYALQYGMDKIPTHRELIKDFDTVFYFVTVPILYFPYVIAFASLVLAVIFAASAYLFIREELKWVIK